MIYKTEKIDYPAMVQLALISDKLAQDWFTYLATVQKRQTWEREALKTGRAKHPGLADYEILGSAV